MNIFSLMIKESFQGYSCESNMPWGEKWGSKIGGSGSGNFTRK